MNKSEGDIQYCTFISNDTTYGIDLLPDCDTVFLFAL